MTTIGYGNQNPHTPEGYILVLVLGTVSMVAFTATSGTAGFIVSIMTFVAVVFTLSHF